MGNMSNVNEMKQMFLAMMQAMKESEAKEKAKRDELNWISKCLHSVLVKHGRFDGRNVTKFLKEYRTEVSIHKLSDAIAIEEFPALVEPELKGIIDNIVAEDATTWERFGSWIKEEFQSEDIDRVTQATFLDWIGERNKGLGPQMLLREFNRRFNQLPRVDAQIIGLQN